MVSWEFHVKDLGFDSMINCEGCEERSKILNSVFLKQHKFHDSCSDPACPSAILLSIQTHSDFP